MAATIEGLLYFLRTYAGIDATVLPDTSAVMYEAFAAATEVVNPIIQTVSQRQYEWAVYNWSTDALINWAPDQPGKTFFADARAKYGIDIFVGGIASAASDEGTSGSLSVPESLMKLSVGDLQSLKTPFGRAYMEQAQKVNSCWGMS